MDFDLKNKTPDVRRLKDIEKVVYDKEWFKTAPDFDVYYMYRNLEKKDGLKYNITVTMPKMLGQEFAKTKGHAHIGNFQEIYIVLEGQALYLMQKGGREKIEDAYAVRAEKGESVIIPAGYGHVTINPSENQDLKTGDWTSENCKSDYSLFEKLHGACYYYTKQGWVKNENYKSVPPLRSEESLKSAPEDLSFLK